ncbi:hypothetical protein EJ03DRAFT_323408 [Teratosphaeria nubilosa]|uniref:SET domain-containing protein n=1 Tax=Teratosphaeria nubilosa TaxID=161662 RepID=A0A6G1LMH9_9PEZI|nr:hypothetical protein EJ03DRAFT_323408 [Teratosphaeria nubilosa]
MADLVALTSSSSSSSDCSAYSTIEVSPGVKAAVMDVDDSSSEPVVRSTPATSVNETDSVGSARKPRLYGIDQVQEESMNGRRSRRAKAGVSTYNLKELSDQQLPDGPNPRSSRNVSGLTGRTLVDAHEDEEAGTPFGDKIDKAMNMDWELTGKANSGSSSRKHSASVQRRPSVKDKARHAAGRLGQVLGKRSRDVLDALHAGKKKVFGKKQKPEADDEEEEEDMPRWKKQLDTGPKGVLDELDLDAEPEMPMQPPAKKAKKSTQDKKALSELAQPPAAPTPIAKASTAGRKMKKWQREGLFVGQEPDFVASKHDRKRLQKKRPDRTEANVAADSAGPKKPFMPLPMFNYLDKTRDFIIPYDIFAPSWKKGDDKPKDWTQINKNRLVGEAKELWARADKLPASNCVCRPSTVSGEPGCNDQCLNRVMQFECTEDNCRLSDAECGNRAFASLQRRTERKNLYGTGVEVVKTENRGFGVRSCRTFAPGQIIMEYTGEIISEGECQRRMRELYGDKQCYYLMELERGLIIDGTKGSMARFINHSCEPNCEVRMVKVNGIPRMGVFAGDDGICTGEELTYDYNFDNFGQTRQICYCGAPKCRGFLSKRLNASEMKKAEKEEQERQRKAAEEVAKLARAEAEKKVVQNARGSSWRGWVEIDDPETKERLRREKREREEAEKNSSRAQRLAKRARSDSMSVPQATPEIKVTPKKERDVKRRKTTSFEETVEEDEEVVTVAEPAVAKTQEAITVAEPTVEKEEVGPVRKTTGRRKSSKPAPRPSFPGLFPGLDSPAKRPVQADPEPKPEPEAEPVPKKARTAKPRRSAEIARKSLTVRLVEDEPEDEQDDVNAGADEEETAPTVVPKHRTAMERKRANREASRQSIAKPLPSSKPAPATAARSHSNGSKFTEDVSPVARPVSRRSTSTITKRTEVEISITRTETEEVTKQLLGEIAHAAAGADKAAEHLAAAAEARSKSVSAAGGRGGKVERKERAKSVLETARGVGQAVRDKLTGASSASGAEESGAKKVWKQSTLNFGPKAQ